MAAGLLLLILLAGCGSSDNAVTTTAAPPTTAVETAASSSADTAPSTTAAPEQEAMDLKYAYGGPNQGAFAETNQWFSDEISARTQGKVNITIHWGGTLVKQPDTLSGVGKGVAEMGAAMSDPTNPHWTTLSLSGAGEDQWAVMMATYEMVNNSPEIAAEMDKANVVPTHGYFPGTPIMILKKQVESLDDLKGLRVRVGTPDEATALSALGVEPVEVGIFEIYDSLGKGVIDGALLTVAWADTLKLGEVAKYWYRFSNNMIGGAVTTVINKDVWAKFTPQTQAIVQELSREYNDKYAQTVMDQEVAVLDNATSTLEVQYLEVPGPVDEAYHAAIDAAHQAWFDKYDADGNKTQAVWDEYQGYVTQYQQEVADKGYPWAQ
ncbi:MAG: TRAP transporter substrate-binding protein DctP [Thermoleophilia bacterium]|nr:TRAP transporter substrate-binding protein DctP [Thermoleophilia bacterium]